MITRVQLSLGSNIGNRAGNLFEAQSHLAGHVGVELIAVSSLYETEPLGKTDQPDFLNMAVEIATKLQPTELLGVVKEIEVLLGRSDEGRWGPRIIDIDIVLWGDLEIDSDILTIPHKDFRRRAFVLRPLAEISPDAVDPVTGMTVEHLAEQPGVGGRVRILPRSDSMARA